MESYQQQFRMPRESEYSRQGDQSTCSNIWSRWSAVVDSVDSEDESTKYGQSEIAKYLPT
jgi:hypothetical protein